MRKLKMNSITNLIKKSDKYDMIYATISGVRRYKFKNIT